MPLTDIPFRRDYTPENCADFVADFYEPALAQAVRYDRTTYTFSATGLQTAARGVAGLLANGGYIRLICDHKVTPETHAAILAGRRQAQAVLRQDVTPTDLTAVTPDDIAGKRALDLLTWLVAENRLDIRVAIVPDDGLFHDKIGIIADAERNCVAFHGSLNETRAGVQDNYESFDVFISWQDPARVADKVEQFDTLWDGKSRRACVIPLPDEYDAYLREYAARNRKPAAPAPPVERAAYWQRIRDAVRDDPATTVATVPAELWPHQASFFNRHAANPGPDRLLLADEVGLGKTIQAGILAKLRINQGRVSRLLVLAPKPACPQWQDELHRKFNIHIPRLETGARAALAYPDGAVADAPNPPWTADTLIASYQWLRQHRDAFLDSEPQYDLVIVDEAHRARFSEVSHESRRRPNQYLELLKELSKRTASLLLLTATPMQLHEAELHALLELLAPVGWTVADFRAFYDAETPPDAAQWRFMADFYRPHSPNPGARDERLIHSGNAAYIANRLDPETITRTARLMRERSPAKRLNTLAGAGHRKIIIFTQFRDTMLYLRERLSQHGHGLIVCLSGQDDPAQGSRDQRIKTLRDADAGLLICTETAAESLNLQFCSAMVNYDIPWNPMTLEQRIGRIDRIGQARPVVDIVNLFYENTAEWDAYQAMLERLEAIHGNVGEYQPILYDPASAGQLAAIIRANGDREATRTAVRNIASAARLNLDTLNSALEQTALPTPAITMADIRRALTEPGLLARQPDCGASGRPPLGSRPPRWQPPTGNYRPGCLRIRRQRRSLVRPGQPLVTALTPCRNARQ